MDAAKAQFMNLKKPERRCVRKNLVSVHAHTHTHVGRAGVSQDLLTTVVGWHNPAWGNMVLVTVRIWSVT